MEEETQELSPPETPILEPVESIHDRINSVDSANSPKPSKPQVWIKLRPSTEGDDSLFRIENDGKGIRLLPSYWDRGFPQGRRSSILRQEKEERGRLFTCDGVLRNSSQEETYNLIAHQLVGKAMDGTSGIIVSVGPESSGKFYNLFGSISKFQYRGIIPRCLERIFQICESKANEYRYLIRMAIVEIRQDKIRDLLSLGSYHTTQHDKDAPHGMIFQKIASAEHGVGLIIRALTCQREIPREPCAKPHTVIFVDVYGEPHKDGIPDTYGCAIKSRITFAKTAAIPERDTVFPPPGPSRESSMDPCGCLGTFIPGTPSVAGDCIKRRSIPNCGKEAFSCTKARSGPINEAIRIRQDLSFLEQMCSRASEYQKLVQDYEKFLRAGIEPNFELPPRSQHYRLSKLTYCLKEIVSGNSEIRIILHVRPERKYKHATLEAMRFADKVKNVPYNINNIVPEPPERVSPSIFNDEFTLVDFLSKMPPQVSDLYIQVQPGTFKTLRDHAAALIDSRVHAVEDLGEERIGELFENFRAIWYYLMDTGSMPVRGPLDKMKPSEDAIEDLEIDDWGRRMTNILSDSEKYRPSGISITSSSKNVIGDEGSSNKSESHQVINLKKVKPKMRSKSAHDKKSKKKGKMKIKNSHIMESPHNRIANSPEDEGEDEGYSYETEHFSIVDTNMDVGSNGNPPSDNVLPEIDINELKLPPSADVPSKEKAWEDFLLTEKGSSKSAALVDKDAHLRAVATEHNDAIRESGKIISRLNSLQTDLNLIQQDRFLKGATYDSRGEIVVSMHEKNIIHEIKNMEFERENLARKTKDIKTQLFKVKRERDEIKTEMEVDFQVYTQTTYGVTYEDSGEGKRISEKPEAIRSDTGSADKERIRKYEDIRRLAKKQARQFLRALVKKPLWVPY